VAYRDSYIAFAAPTTEYEFHRPLTQRPLITSKSSKQFHSSDIELDMKGFWCLK
jgi:hypothetical protein